MGNKSSLLTQIQKSKSKPSLGEQLQKGLYFQDKLTWPSQKNAIQNESLYPSIIMEFILMSKQEQDPFLVIKNYPSPYQIVPQAYFKKRKPTAHSWTKQEHMGYLRFFWENLQIASNEATRKTNKIFVMMAKYIPTRSSSQIKSHHQKLMGKFKSLDAILRELAFFLQIQRKESGFQFICAQGSTIKEVEGIVSHELQLTQALSGQRPYDVARSDITISLDEAESKIFDVLESFQLSIPGNCPQG